MSKVLLRVALAVGVVAGGAVGCGDDAPPALSNAEVLQIGTRCLDGVESLTVDGAFKGLNDPARRECLRRLSADPVGRLFLVGASTEAVAGWAGGFASAVGDGLEAGEGDLFALIRQKDSIPMIQGGAEDLGALLGQLGAVRADVTDEKQAAAEMVGVMSFLLSQGPGPAAPTAGTALGGGFGGLAAEYGAGQLTEMAAGFIADAEKRFEEAKWKSAFIRMIESNLEHIMIAALWADPRIRANLRAGDPPDHLPVVGPPLTDPPLEDPEGVLRVPRVDEQPARDTFMDWLDQNGTGAVLGTAGAKALDATGISQSFTDQIVQSLFEEG